MKLLYALADRQTKLLHFSTCQQLKDKLDQLVDTSKLSDDNLGNRTYRFKDSECELEKFREATLGNGELLATAMGAYRSRMSANNKSGGTVLNHIADTKFSAKDSRWSNLTKGVPGMDHKWSTMTITSAEKEQDELSVESKAKIAIR